MSLKGSEKLATLVKRILTNQLTSASLIGRWVDALNRYDCDWLCNVVQSDPEEVDRSERVGPRAQFCRHRCQDTGAVCSAFGITRALSFTQDTVVTELLPRRQLAQWEDGIERNKMAVGGEKCIVGYIEKGSKRILRSNEYMLPPSGLMETDLELTFSLQYPHFLKRDANRLQIMLQRRKRYKNRTILGYKTLAVGVINMAERLAIENLKGTIHHSKSSMRNANLEKDQNSGFQMWLKLGNKDKKATYFTYLCWRVRLFRVFVFKSTHRPGGRQWQPETKAKASDRSPDMDNYSEDDDDSYSSEQEASDDAVQGQDLYDEDDDVQRKPKKSRRKMIRTTSMTRVCPSALNQHSQKMIGPRIEP
ncbi:phosphofurin acidic cluster sorting protein [Pimephales promelas]|nr:phosphofurin acidic cluster sorting protein [Pimephales promelas]